MGDLGVRLVAAVDMIVLALLALWLGGIWFTLFWLVASAAIFWEWLGLAGSAHRNLSAAAGAAVLAIAAWFSTQGAVEYAVLAVCAGAAGAAFVERNVRPGWAAMGLLYAGALVIAVVSLRMSLLLGVQAILWLFAVVWGTDIFAYFGGRLIGGPKIWPRISPSKTWSGFASGVTGGAIAGVLVLWLTIPPGQQSIGIFLVLGLVTGAVSQGGDFLESAIKRRFDAKDASNLIPGHGGVMDRLDGFIAACVLAAAIGIFRNSAVNPAAGLLIW